MCEREVVFCVCLTFELSGPRRLWRLLAARPMISSTASRPKCAMPVEVRSSEGLGGSLFELSCIFSHCLQDSGSSDVDFGADLLATEIDW